MDLVAPDGGLWIRRQVFEHSVSSATLLGPSTAARIDFPRLAAALAAASVTMHPDEPPAVTYSSWAAVAEELAHLTTPDDADLIIEALETNAPNAFVRCNDPEKLAPGRQVDYRHLLIPVPELLAFLKLHAAAALAARFRENADSVWPASAADAPGEPPVLLSAPAPMEQAPASPDAAAPAAGSHAPAAGLASGTAPVSLSPLPIPSMSILAGSGSSPGVSSPKGTATTPKSHSHVAPPAPGQQSPQLRPQVAAAAAPPSPSAAGPPPSSSEMATAVASGAAASLSFSPPSGQLPTLSPPRASVTPPSGVPLLTLRSPSGRSSLDGDSNIGEGSGPLSRKKSAPHSPMINSPSAIVASVSHSLQRETHLVAQVLPALLTCIAGAYGVVAEVQQSPAKGSASGSLAASPRASNKSKDGTPRTPSPLPLSHMARTGDGATGDRAGGVEMEDDGARDTGEKEKPNAVGTGGGGEANVAENSPVRDRQLLSKAGLGLMSGVNAGSDSTLSDLDGVNAAASKSGEGSAMMGTLPGGKSSNGGSSGTLGSSGASDSSTGRAQSVNSIMITRNLFEHLSFLLTTAASADGDKHLPIYTIVPEWRDPACNDPVPLGRLVELTTTALTTMSADMESGPIDTAEIRDLERKTIIRSQLPETSVDPTEFPHGREVRITNCCDANVYLLCSLGRVSLIACRDFVLFVGSCVSVSVINCERVKVHTVARVCRVTNCFDSEMYLCTNRRPQIVGDCRGISFAPYNASYHHIQRDVAAVGVDPTRNIWDQYFRPSMSRDRNASSEPDLSPAVVTTLAPARFFSFVVPVVPDSDGRLTGAADNSDAFGERDPSAITAIMNLDLPLPQDYQTAISERRQFVETLLKEVNKLDAEVKGDVAMSDSPTGVEADGSGVVTPPSGFSSPRALKAQDGNSDAQQSRHGLPMEGANLRAHVQHLIQERFRAWLVSSNNMRQVGDLSKMDRDIEVAGSGRMDGSPEIRR